MESSAARTSSEIAAWLVEEVARAVRCSPDEIDARLPFVEYGIGSAQALDLVAKTEAWLGVPLSPTMIWDYPSIDALALHLADLVAPAAPARCRDAS